MPKPLVIVESPAKARTIAGFLGADFLVESSVGHIRDLPRSSAEIPKAYKGEEWAQRTGGVDYTSDFKPVYIVPKEKKDQVKKLKSLLSEASELYLATDEDREGESIAWHLLEVLSPGGDVPVRRMVFHEITEAAIREAIESWRELDRRLVDAQEARRILDRLVGWEVSPILWRMVRQGLSAGRVQSVATRLVVMRERERMAFRSAGYHDLEGSFEARDVTFSAALVEVGGQRVANGRDFDASTGRLREDSGALALDEERAAALVEGLEGAEFSVAAVESKDYTQSPYAPFITSTLQQEAGRKLRWSAARAMAVAQRLYERGYITYMRTDSTALSEQAVSAARSEVERRYGREYLPAQARVYRRKVKSAQEAHEAIRPAGETFRAPEDVAGELDGDEQRLYDLVWKRTVACQMADARGKRLSLRLSAPVSAAGAAAAFASDGGRAVFAASGKTIEFPGFLRAYVEGSDDPDAELEDQERRLPSVQEGEAVACSGLAAVGHATQPPARYTEASLVKELENRGIGRPSTYASVLDTIQSRGYVFKKGSALVPTWTGMAVTQLLERKFSAFVDYDFTARMEADLDAMAGGQIELAPWLRDFYFGNGQVGLREMVDQGLDDVDPREVCTVAIERPSDGATDDQVVVRVGRFGPYIQRGESDDKASIPDDLPPDELTLERALEQLEQAKKGGRVLGQDPQTGLDVTVRHGRFGPYFQVGEATDEDPKPNRASLLKSWDPETVSLDEALQALSLPRVVGTAEDGSEITAQTGRFGPYIKAGTETRSLDTEEQIFTLTEADARELLKQPKRGRRRGPAVLREVGEHPDTGASIRVLEGRYGPYVTDGDVNASLPRGRTPEEVELDEAVELLKERAARAGQGGGRRSGGGSRTSSKSKSKSKSARSKSSSRSSSTKRPKKQT